MQVKVQGANEEMLMAACQQFLGKHENEIMEISRETLEGHQRAIMGNMTVEVLCGSFIWHASDSFHMLLLKVTKLNLFKTY